MAQLRMGLDESGFDGQWTDEDVREWQRIVAGFCALFNAQSLDGVDGCGAESGDDTRNACGESQHADGSRHH